MTATGSTHAPSSARGKAAPWNCGLARGQQWTGSPEHQRRASLRHARPGEFNRTTPFFVGLTGALGVALAYVLVRSIADVAQVSNDHRHCFVPWQSGCSRPWSYGSRVAECLRPACGHHDHVLLSGGDRGLRGSGNPAYFATKPTNSWRTSPGTARMSLRAKAGWAIS